MLTIKIRSGKKRDECTIKTPNPKELPQIGDYEIRARYDRISGDWMTRLVNDGVVLRETRGLEPDVWGVMKGVVH